MITTDTELLSKKLDYYYVGLMYKVDWKVDNGRICISGDIPNSAVCWTYSFQGNDKLILEIIPGMPITLNRIISSATERENEQTWTNGTIALQDIQYTKKYSSKFGDYNDVEVWFNVDYNVHIDTQMTKLQLKTNKGNMISCTWDSLGTNGVYSNEQFLYETISFSRTNSPGNFNLYLRNTVDTSGFSSANMLMNDENVTSFIFTIVNASGNTEYTVTINNNMISNHTQENISEKFLGIWKRETSGILSTFNSDGSYVTEGQTYQWSLESNKYFVMIGGTKYTYIFSNNDTRLTLNNIQKGTTLVYTRQ